MTDDKLAAALHPATAPDPTGEVSSAVDRGARALSYQAHMRDPIVPPTWWDEARECLSEALDVEEMASTIWEASRTDEGTISATGAKIVAKALRARMLRTPDPTEPTPGAGPVEEVARALFITEAGCDDPATAERLWSNLTARMPVTEWHRQAEEVLAALSARPVEARYVIGRCAIHDGGRDQSCRICQSEGQEVRPVEAQEVESKRPDHNLMAERDAALARAEAAEAWKDEALPVMAGLQNLGRALGLGLGTSITGEMAAQAACGLVARAEAAEHALADLRAGLKALADESGLRGSPFIYATEARALLAAPSPGSTPGTEMHAPCLSDGVPDEDGKALPAGLCYVCQRPEPAHRTTPKPDTTERSGS